MSLKTGKKYKAQIISLKIVKEGNLEYSSERMSFSDDAAIIARKFIGNADREHLIAIYINAKHMITAIHTVSIGTVNQSVVHPREVFKGAILSNALAVIIAHNHPSGDGDITPSKEDLQATKRLKEAGEILGIKLLDHIIVSGDRHFSFMSEKLI